MSGIRLGDVVEHVIGGGWGADEAAEDRTPVRVIRGADFPEVERRSLEGVPLRFEDARKVPTRTLRVGDIVLEISGGTADRPTGRTVLVTDRLLESSELPLIPASFCRLLRTDSTRVIGPFAYYALRLLYLQGGTWLFQNRSTGISNLQYPLLAERYHLPDFPLPIQRAIAEVLGALDDKIAANQNVARSADDLASALAAREMSGFSRLEDIAELVMGSSPRGESLNDQGDGIEFFQGVRDFGVRVPVSRVSTTEPTRIAQDGDVLLSVRAPVGRVNRADRTMCVGRGLAAIRSVFPNAIFHALKLATVWESFNGEGTVFGSIAGPQLRSVALPWPPADRVAPLELMLEPIEARIDTAVSESARLAELRDTLLPHLMSGRLSVRDAEAQVEAVL